MPTDRERLASRLNTILDVLGIADVRIAPADVRRVHAGRYQRERGAFSWFAQPMNTGRLVSLGSQFRVADCARLPVIVSPSFDGWVLDPVFPEAAPPQCAARGAGRRPHALAHEHAARDHREAVTRRRNRRRDVKKRLPNGV